MTLGEKIRKARTENGFTQEQLAEKMFVSRQAITKWEANKGIPDVNNLKMLAQLLNVSVDYLLDDGKKTDMNIIRESINLSQYGRSMNKKSLADKLIREKFPKAEIHRLLAKKKMDNVEKTAETFLWLTSPFANVIEIMNGFKLLGTNYYLINDGNRQFFVLVNYKEEFMEIHRMAEFQNTQNGNQFIVGDIVFTVGCEIHEEKIKR